MGEITCPDCGTELTAKLNAELPASTDLTISLTVTPGQLIRLDTLAGVLSNWRDMQVTIGREMGITTDVFLAGLSMENDVISITTRIANVALSPREEG